MSERINEPAATGWMVFHGGELEGRRPKLLCSACRERRGRETVGRSAGVRGGTLCFQCYRVDVERERALKRAGELDTESAARFQFALPFEPVNRARLERFKGERATARADIGAGGERFVDRRRRAQIAARHALQAVARGFGARQLSAGDRERAMAAAIHAAELQLPEAWLPFVTVKAFHHAGSVRH